MAAYIKKTINRIQEGSSSSPVTWNNIFDQVEENFDDVQTAIDELDSKIGYSATNLPTPDILVKRDLEGRARVEDPSHDLDIANKQYVSQKVGEHSDQESGVHGIPEGERALHTADIDDQSLTTNGYQVLPGGLILQWATTEKIFVGTDIGDFEMFSVDWPISFPNGVISCQLSLDTGTFGEDGPNEIDEMAYGIGERNTTGAQGRVRRIYGTNTDEEEFVRFSFFAIGH